MNFLILLKKLFKRLSNVDWLSVLSLFGFLKLGGKSFPDKSCKEAKAEIEKLMGLAKYKDKLLGQRSKKNVGEYIMASNQVGFSKKVKEGVQAKYGPKSFEEILSTDLENFKFGDSDIGKILLNSFYSIFVYT